MPAPGLHPDSFLADLQLDSLLADREAGTSHFLEIDLGAVIAQVNFLVTVLEKETDLVAAIDLFLATDRVAVIVQLNFLATVLEKAIDLGKETDLDWEIVPSNFPETVLEKETDLG